MEDLTLQRPRLQFPYDYPEGIQPPWLFARERLGIEPYPKQVEALEALGQGLPVSLVAANGSGKTTTVIAPFILWFMDAFGDRPGAKVVVTSGSWLQVETQLAPAIRKYAHQFPEWEFQSVSIKRRGSLDDFVVMFSTQHPGRAEGHHGNEFAPLLVIVDEAKTVPDAIFEALSRCTVQFQLFTSSPGPDSGKFYRTFGKERQFFYPIKLKSEDCPHIDPAKRERDRLIYGENSPIFRSMHLAEFSEGDDLLILSKRSLRECVENPPDYMEGPRIAFCDFAAGGDENVIAVRHGNRAWIAASWRESDTNSACNRFKRHFDELNLVPSQTFGDVSGLGVVFIDRLREMGFPMNRVNNGAAPSDKGKEHFADRGTEIWVNAARSIENRKVILSPDPDTFEQATTRRLEYTAQAKLKAEPKDKMKARGLPSPDRADALFGAISCGPEMFGAITSTAGIRLPQSSFNRPPSGQFR